MKMNRENANRETIKALPIIRKGEETKTQDNALFAQLSRRPGMVRRCE